MNLDDKQQVIDYLLQLLKKNSLVSSERELVVKILELILK